jgi:ribonuclease-3
VQHEFKNPALLEHALTHRSVGASNYERLEFLGDGLINFVVGEILYAARPQASEGDLSRLRASLVCEESLARIAESLQLGEALRLGAGELKSGGYRRESILADALEAVLGAIYLDGGFEIARSVCLSLFESALGALPDAAALKDPKTRLQELLQGQGRPLPRYEVIEESGPAHRRQFRVRCSLGDAQQATEASAASRRAAEQIAADEMFSKLEQDSFDPGRAAHA